MNLAVARLLSKRRVGAEWRGFRIEASIDSYALVRDLRAYAYEEHATRRFAEHSKPGTVVVDVGANIGIYTLLAARAGASVTALEPVPQTRADLERNLRLNGLRAQVLQKAAGDREETRTFYIRRPSGHSGLHPAAEQYLEEISVETVRLDRLMSRIDLLKVDAEGSELEVLRGAGDLLRGCTLLIEYAPYALQAAGHTGDELLEFLHARFASVQAIDARTGALTSLEPSAKRSDLWCT